MINKYVNVCIGWTIDGRSWGSCAMLAVYQLITYSTIQLFISCILNCSCYDKRALYVFLYMASWGSNCIFHIVLCGSWT